jgi:hypothetical protein
MFYSPATLHDLTHQKSIIAEGHGRTHIDSIIAENTEKAASELSFPPSFSILGKL